MSPPASNSTRKRITLSLIGLLVPVAAALVIGFMGTFMMAMAIDGSGRNNTEVMEHSLEIYYLAMVGIASSGLLFGFAFAPAEPVKWLIQSGVVIAGVSVLAGAGTVFAYLFSALP